MPDVSITIGGRQFEVACQDGEESFLKAAAEVLDGEARLLTDQVGRLAENRMPVSQRPRLLSEWKFP